MTEQARHKLNKTIGEAIEAFVEEVTPKPKPPPDTEEDLNRPMSYDEFNGLSLLVPPSVLSYVTGLSQASIRDFRNRRRRIPLDVASKLRRLYRYITELASDRQASLGGAKRMWQTEKKSK